MKKAALFFLLSTLISFEIFSQISLPDVETAISIGITNSKLMTEKQKNAMLQMKNSKYSIISFLPKISFSWNEYNEILISNPDSNVKSFECSISQLLFDNGKTYLNYSINKYMSYLSFLEIQKEIQKHSLSILQTYYNLILQNMLIKIKTEQLENTKNELQIIKYKYESGLALNTDLLQFQISSKELYNDCIELNQQKQTLITTLQNLLNVSSSTSLEIPENIISLEYSTTPLIPHLSEYQKKITDASIEIKQADADYKFQKKQYRISNHPYFPDISLQGGISFSGTHYPLTQPDYAIKLIFSFSNLPFLPLNYEASNSIKNKKFKTISNSASTTLDPDISYFTKRKITKSNLIQSQLNLENELIQTKNTITQYINEHDNLIDYISLLQDALEIKKQKFQISSYEYENGLLSTTDYLKEQNEISEYEQKLNTSQIQLLILQKKIEILTE